VLFNSLSFFVFFSCILLLFPLVPRKWRHLLLLAASLLFYMGWNASYVLLMLTSIGTTFACGIALDHAQTKGRKQLALAACFAVNLLILFFFKYANFALESLDAALVAFGFYPRRWRLDVLLPVGISFYTFQALGYIVDVYRGTIPCEKSFTHYALFVSFFPQLVAGPIERSKNLLDQIHALPDRKAYDWARVKSGLTIMLWGYFMKMVIADRAAVLVDTVYNAYWQYRAFGLIVATVCFAIQIYCDFASYSTIAIGAARVLGFTLMENFDTPYFARSIKEFWRRWHISLSTWFRDYLYIPLGGSRCGAWRARLNLMIVFLVSGLWHGASWTFVIWGLLHGVYQIAGGLLRPYKDRLYQRLHVNTACFSHTLAQTLCTFALVCFAWIFFRAETLHDAFSIITRIFTMPDPWSLFNGEFYELGLSRPQMNILLSSAAALMAVDLVKYKTGKTIDSLLASQNTWFRWLVLIGLIMSIVIFGMYGPEFNAQAFIYFQF